MRLEELKRGMRLQGPSGNVYVVNVLLPNLTHVRCVCTATGHSHDIDQIALDRFELVYDQPEPLDDGTISQEMTWPRGSGVRRAGVSVEGRNEQ